MAKLDRSIALVTGGSSGIGAAIARLFAGERAAVIIVAHELNAASESRVAGIEKAGVYIPT